MCSFNWQDVVDVVVKEFPTYIPVPSREIEDYRIFNFMRLAEESNPSSYPRFYYYGNEGDISYTNHLANPNPKPEVTSRKLWACNEREGGYRTAGYIRQKSQKKVTFSLGTISEHKVSYGDLQNWICKVKSLKSDVEGLVEEQNLYVIHTAIMAEMLVIKKDNEESKADLSRPKEFGSFPIGFRVGKVLSNAGYPVSLHLEELRYFNIPYTCKEWWAKHAASTSAK